MKLRNLIVKQYTDLTTKLINLQTGEEANADDEALSLLQSISKKQNHSFCTNKELELLTAIKEGINIEAFEGIEDLKMRKGDFENLEIYVCNSCNLRCKHCCFFCEGLHDIRIDLDFELFKRTINEGIELGLCKLSLIGGDPFTYNRIDDLLEFVNNLDIRTTFITNGLLLNNYISKLNNTRISFVVSLDGFQASHDYLRGNGTYEKTFKNIEQAINLGFDLIVSTVVFDKNIGELDEFANFMQNIGVSGLNVQVIRPVGRAEQFLTGNLITDEVFLRKIHENELSNQIAKIESGKSFCTSCKTGLVIDFNANVLGCKLVPELISGNLNQNSLSEIYKKTLNESPIFNIDKNTECFSCELFNNSCAGGCRARAKITNGSLLNCDYWIPFLLNHPKFSESKRQANEFLII